MRRLYWALVVGVASVTAACTRDNNQLTLPITDTNVVGSFNLTSANGRVLPYTAFLTSTAQWDVAADRIVIAADNTWADTTSYNVSDLTTGAVTSQSTATAGTYKIANGQIQFVMTDGGTAIFAGAVQGNTLSVLFNGQPFIYAR
ncbi:MAG TPA: hypothetical protein VH277_18770 [Gemmatimonadaceae bacterium]|jgi:hypothetical protein|nr:hypothetical protein [Gemmatimonadaceae bacterium]